MAGTIEELISELESEELEKNASKEVEAEDILADEVMARALEKIAAATEEEEPEEDDGDEETEEEEEIEDKVEEEIEEEMRGLTRQQKEKVASISGKFSSPTKAKLFEKVASFALLNNPRVIRDNNFQKYETLDGLPKEIEMFFDAPGEEVNNI